MSEIAEKNLWYRGKAPIIDKFKQDRDFLLSQTAAKINNVPGYLLRDMTLLEIQTKYALSDLNFKITQEALDRELNQLNFDYDMTYKQAALTWELEKITLYDSLKRELADAKKSRSDDEQTLSLLAIEVGLRQIVLINSKTSIELEIEALQKELVETQGLTLDKEVALAQQKLATATRKLDIIPSLQALITAQENLLVAEENLVPLTEDLINARLDQIPLQEEIANLKTYLVEAMNALTTPQLEVAEKKILLANARIAYETRATDKITPATNLATSLTAMNAALSVYINKRGELVDPYLERATKLSDLITPRTAYAQAITATIPYLKALAIERQKLIAPSLAKAEALSTLIDPTMQRAEAELLYVEKLKNIAQLEEDIQNIYLLLEELKKTQIDADLEYLSAKLANGDLEEALITANLILDTLKVQHQTDLTEDSAEDTAEYLAIKEAGQINIIQDESAAAETGIDTKLEVARIKMEADLDSIKTTIAAQAGNSGSIEKISRLHANASVDRAEINASANITSSLIHQLS